MIFVDMKYRGVMVRVAHPVGNPAYARSADVPSGFDPSMKSLAPMCGLVQLPVRLWWSAQDDKPLDLESRQTRIFVYEQVLQNGTSTDVLAWINPSELLACWDDMQVTSAVADTWQPWVYSHR